MAFINGYQYNTIEEVEKACDTLNSHHGLPVKDGVTIFDESSFIRAGKTWVMPFDAEWTAILGTPQEITIE